MNYCNCMHRQIVSSPSANWANHSSRHRVFVSVSFRSDRMDLDLLDSIRVGSSLAVSMAVSPCSFTRFMNSMNSSRPPGGRGGSSSQFDSSRLLFPFQPELQLAVVAPRGLGLPRTCVQLYPPPSSVEKRLLATVEGSFVCTLVLSNECVRTCRSADRR